MIVAALVVVLASWPLQVDDGGFVAGGTSGQWEWGMPTTGPAGPDRVWATNLEGFALNDAVDFLEIPLPDHAGADQPVLVLDHWYAFGPGDRGVLEVDPGTGWQILPAAYGYPDPTGFVGASGGIVRDAFPLDAYGPTARVRLVFASDPSLSAEGWYVTEAVLYDGDVVPPRIDVVQTPSDTTDLVGPYPFVFDVRDDRALLDVRLVVSLNGSPETLVALESMGSDRWQGALPALAPGTRVTWRVEADDAEQTARFPPDDDGEFRVFLPPPVNLRGPPGRVIGGRLGLQWQAPEAIHPVVGYEIVDQASVLTLSDLPFATVPVVVDGANTWTVRARFAFGAQTALGDPSEPLTLDVEVPSLDPLVPDAGGPGERLWIQIAGQSLYLEPLVVEVDLGEGVLVEDVQVLDAERAIARVRIADDAAPGPRDARIVGAQGVARFPEAFLVLDAPVAGGEAVVTPSVLFQGRPTTITVTTPVALGDAVVVDGGPDLVVLGEVVVEGDKVRFDLLAPLGTAPGQRTLLLDDGARILGADLVVRESITQVGGPCATVPGPFPAAALAGLALLLRRRRSVRA